MRSDGGEGAERERERGQRGIEVQGATRGNPIKGL